MNLWYAVGAGLGIASWLVAVYDAAHGRWGAATGGAMIGVWVLYLVVTRPK